MLRSNLGASICICCDHICITEFEDGDALYAHLVQGNTDYDLLIMDVLMGSSNGIETADRIRKLGLKLPLLFLSVSPEFAVYGYDVDAAAYLLKPLDPERLKRTLDKLIQKKRHSAVISTKKAATCGSCPLRILCMQRATTIIY